MADQHTLSQALTRNFLGHSPNWYKLTIIGFLIANPVLFAISHTLAGWVLVLEFIFTLAMALRCYPLQPGGLLAIEAVLIGMTSAGTVYEEAVAAVEVIFLLTS
jgi:NhaB family Na+:H+ antiporter